MNPKEENINPHDLINKHIQNKDHVVTDEELDNVKVGDAAMSEEELKKEVKEMEQEFEHKPHSPNPYDVL